MQFHQDVKSNCNSSECIYIAFALQFSQRVPSTAAYQIDTLDIIIQNCIKEWADVAPLASLHEYLAGYFQ